MWGNFVTDKTRIIKPAIKSEELPNIITSDMIELLKPERRFDQTLYFTYRMNED
ncbi:TPA: HindVP family restriction endonuclease [Streptococcus suis]|nr:HindVP family restriction endonuclease [Streptococcus suis]